MNYQLTFSLALDQTSVRFDQVCISDGKLFNKIRDHFSKPSRNPRWFQVEIDYQNAISTRLFEAIYDKTGRRPLADILRVNDAHDPRHFQVVVTRVPSKEELYESPLLMLLPPTGTIATYDFDHKRQDSGFTVKGAGRRTKLLFGGAEYMTQCMIFKDQLKNELMKARLRGIEFRPVRISKGKQVPLWQLWSEVEMPPAINRLEPEEGSFCMPQLADEGSYTPSILRYEQSSLDLARLPDVVRAQECIMSGIPCMLVSQRFRQVADKLAPGQFRYGLVAVGEGEELQKRYTIPELAPPLA